MQKLKFAAVFLLPVYFLLAGCDNSSPTGADESKKGIDSRLVGDWECYKTVTAGITQELPENARMKMSFTSDGSYDLASTDEGTWRTSNDSLYIKSSINNVEILYAVYEISGSDVVFDIAGNQQYYKKANDSDGPDDVDDPVNIDKQNLYGKWTCYQVVFEDGEVWSDKDEDWENMEFSFSATQAEMISDSEKLETSSWDLQDGLIIMEFGEETMIFPIISLDNETLTVGLEELGFVIYFKKS